MAATEDRLFQLLDQEVERKHAGWGLADTRGAQILTPVEPCNQCGVPVYLIRWQGRDTWREMGEIKDEDTLFPSCTQRLHRCQDGDLVDAEAAILVDSTSIEAPVAAALGCGGQT